MSSRGLLASANASALDPMNYGYACNYPPMLATLAIGLTANRAFYVRLMTGGVISKVRINVVASAGNVSVAAYQNSGTGTSAVPGTRLATSGSVACPSIGIADVSLGATITVRPGDWLAISASSASATFSCSIVQTIVAPHAAGVCGYQDTAHPLPATPSPSAGIIGPILLMGVA